MLTCTQSERQLLQANAYVDQNKSLENRILEAIRDSTSELREQIDELSKSLDKASSNGRYGVIDEWHDRNQSDIVELSGTFSGLAREDEHTRIVGLFLHSLNFPQLKERHTRIIEAHWATLDWVLKRDLGGSVPWANFVE